MPDSITPPAGPSPPTPSTRGYFLARLDRDELRHILNTRRSSIQQAADAVWPHSHEANRPIR